MKRSTPYIIIVAALALLVVACAAVVKASQTALDIGAAACSVVEQNYTNNTVTVACDYIDKADSASHLLSMVLPTAQATGFVKSPKIKYVGAAPSAGQ